MLLDISSLNNDFTSRRKAVGRRTSSLGAADSSRYNLSLEYKSTSHYESGMIRRASE